MIDRLVDRIVVPIVALFVYVPLLAAWHVVAQRENARRGRR